MSEQEIRQEQEVSEEANQIDYQEQLQDMQSQIDAMKNKNAELLDELKKNKEQRRAAQEQAEKEKKKKMHEAGEFEQLYQSAIKENEQLQEQLKDINTKAAQQKRKNVAMKIASELANPRDVENLAVFVEQRLNEDGSKVLDPDGQLTVSSYDQLKQEFQDAERFASMLKGNQSSGGGAPGANGGAGSATTLTRAKFDQLGQLERSQFINDGGKVI